MKGAWGEEAAAEFLRKKGYRIIARNYRTRMGELDIVAEKGEYLAIVEVKTRKNDRFSTAREAITPAKQRRLIAAAQYWLMEHPTDKQPRFDAVEVYGEENGPKPQIFHWENIFET